MVLLLGLVAAAAATTTDFTFRETVDEDSHTSEAFSVDTEGLRLVVGTPSHERVTIFDSLDGLTWTETDTVQASDGVSGDMFGRSCRLSGDILLVTASKDNSNTGAGYVFKTTDGVNWVQQDKLVPSWAGSGDYAGEYSTSDLDGLRIVIGSIEDNSAGPSRSGSVAVFESTDDGATWTETAAWSSSSAVTNGFFGRAAVYGDRIAVGAFGEDKVHVYTTTDGGTTWPERQVLVATGYSAGYFGVSISMSGEYMAIGDNGYSSERGAVSIFSTSNDGLTWSHVENLFQSSAAAGDNCGAKVRMYDYVVASACWQDSNVGLVVVFESTDSGATWSETYQLTAPSGGATPAFGKWETMAMSNGFLAVGAYAATVGTNTGATFTYGMASAIGAGGDPVVVDFAGHRFLAGTQAHEVLVLYMSDVATIKATTGEVLGLHNGYFLASVTVESHGCAESVTLRAAEKLALEVSTLPGDGACVRSQLALGDNGLGLILVDGDAQTAMAVKTHVSNGFSFVNIHMMGVTPEFRKRCQSGLLCDEDHLHHLTI